MNIHRLLLAGMIGFVVFASSQVRAQEQERYVGSEAFERVKQLVGSWEGTIDMGEGPEKITASYKLTSGGSAIVETVFEGAPHEMVTLYHDSPNQTLSMTHYCMLHNQPKMILKGMENNELTFDLSKDADIDVAHDPHMHSLTIRFDGHDKMTQHWTKFEGGTKKQAVEIVYIRVQ